MEEMTGAAAVQIPALLAEEFHLPRQRVEATIELIDQGNTLPFIARYRKEATGSMDDQLLRQLWEPAGLSAGLGAAQAGGSGSAGTAGAAGTDTGPFER